ncbi:hypothetical protein CEXT_528451 [Caerostris extrusa]|uniref:Uncharacterized protein n=1 Tax=Caerostris extrusa TaxID=172846 RepID=A0AAV4VA99_CAEEX|nr:hypothetical protein CEXT_528451 [Caerostris extrusa]
MAKVVVCIVLHKGRRMSGVESDFSSFSKARSKDGSLEYPSGRHVKEGLECAISPFLAFGAIALQEDSYILNGAFICQMGYLEVGRLKKKTDVAMNAANFIASSLLLRFEKKCNLGSNFIGNNHNLPWEYLRNEVEN